MVDAETITPNDDVMALSDRQLLERVARQLDHLDVVAHQHMQELADQGAEIGSVNAQIAELTAQLQPLWPLIPRALALLDPMRKMRKPKPDAVPQ